MKLHDLTPPDLARARNAVAAAVRKNRWVPLHERYGVAEEALEELLALGWTPPGAPEGQRDPKEVLARAADELTQFLVRNPKPDINNPAHVRAALTYEIADRLREMEL